MREIPFTGRIDVAVACLLVVERHGSVANRRPTESELADDVLALVEHLEVPPACLGDVESFDGEVRRALHRLIAAGWIQGRTAAGVSRFGPRPVAGPAVDWIRTRLAVDARSLGAFERLDRAVTDRVLADYGHAPEPYAG